MHPKGIASGSFNQNDVAPRPGGLADDSRQVRAISVGMAEIHALMSVFFITGSRVSAMVHASVGHLETDGVEHYLNVTEKRNNVRGGRNTSCGEKK